MGGGIVQSEAGIAVVAGSLKGGGEREDGGGALIQVKEGGGASVPCLLYFPFHFSFASFWLAVRLFLDKNEIDRIPTTPFF